MNFRQYKAKLRLRRASDDDWETNETIDWLINDEGLTSLAHEAVRSGWQDPGGALRALIEEVGSSLDGYNVDLDLVDWDAVAEYFAEDEEEEDESEDILGPKTRALLDRDTPRQAPQVQPVVGQQYRVGDLPPGSVVRATSTDYVVSQSGLAMRWEQPIAGSDNWQVTYVGQLPPGQWMTEQEWQEVAATGSQPEVNNDLFAHPDPWMDNEPGSLTFPAEWRQGRVGMSHGLIPCPYCGGDIQDDSQRGRLVCSGCRRVWPTRTNDQFDRAMRQLHPGNLDTHPCPKCGSTMHWRGGDSLGRMWRDGAWECSNQRCWHMLPPGAMVPDTYQDPDAPGDFTLPENFS